MLMASDSKRQFRRVTEEQVGFGHLSPGCLKGCPRHSFIHGETHFPHEGLGSRHRRKSYAFCLMIVQDATMMSPIVMDASPAATQVRGKKSIDFFSSTTCIITVASEERKE